MLNRIKSAPTLVLVLFALVLSLEITSFVLSPQVGSVVRFVLLSALMFLTLGGLWLARNILIFLLLAGSLFLAISNKLASEPVIIQVSFQYLPAAALLAAAMYLLRSKQFKTFLITKPDQGHGPKST